MNALNFIRLMLAVSVIVWHSFPLTGNTVDWPPAHQALSLLGVDGFFAISGFLIYGSWKRNPSWWRYLAARALRIFPAFWVCLILTAFVIAPITTALVTGRTYLDVISLDNLRYVLQNAALRIFDHSIGGTPLNVPYPGYWNGSLWTLFWEFLCYLGVLAAGLLALYRFRATVPIIFGLTFIGLLATAYGPVENYWAVQGSRFGIMFAAGMLIEQYAHRIPVSWPLLGAAAAVTAASMVLPDYRAIGALPWAYLMLGLGAMLKHPRLRFENDISYGVYIYGMPVQQVLASFGLAALGVPLFSVLSILLTLPLAAASWFLLERHAMKLRPKRRAQRNVQTEVVAG
ncbi:acyltransferase family protein [Microbacterium sp. NPDC077663]|uniref:acyltransferase family protein n=1 Tax=Microbacterium sp. NPDC077663 TaxID=3364189 RepID=UPI0037C82198